MFFKYSIMFVNLLGKILNNYYRQNENPGT